MNKSEQINELATALCKVQSKIEDAAKDKEGYNYKYADLSQILQIIRPILTENDLCLSQFPSDGGDNIALDSILMHSSGQWLSNHYSMPVEAAKGMTRAQASGSVITYMRRYAAAAIVGITQEDDDAAAKRKEANKDYSEQIEAYIAEKDPAEQKIMWEMFKPDEQRAVSNHFNKQG